MIRRALCRLGMHGHSLIAGMPSDYRCLHCGRAFNR